ncbi:Uncharacterised protein (plasmid) [Legionella adelaidensis]|uniref:Uncharacterized protein n=1 Tax=Legionella adelaidensis TaxID=45056 RepID=A0A0W0R3Q5_9GAMM|nr:hypothetical protein [Legionella adelaidensis]KTC65658.1 hypothetical protein Lade_0316 [Legionella adelaidensis]VEH85146.1 Uncharacterised protein [Legionella adelaidensis]
MGRFTSELSSRISQKDSKYKRPLFQTYLTALEWRNVEMAEEFGDFLGENKPFYMFPFFKQLLTFWKIFIKSYAQARKEHTHKEIIFSEYMLMSLFIGINTSLEWGAKGLISLLCWPLLSENNATSFQHYVASAFQDYGLFIHTTPFYNYSYFQKLTPLKNAFWNSEHKTLADCITFFVVSIDLIARGIVSAPIAYWYNQEADQAAPTSDIIVKKGKTSLADFSEGLSLLHQVNPNISLVDEDAPATRFSTKKQETYGYQRIRVPRYQGFLDAINTLHENGYQVAEIAGQKKVQIRCISSNDISGSDHYETIYTYQNSVKQHTFFALDVTAKNLQPTIEEIRSKDAEIKLIHAF